MAPRDFSEDGAIGAGTDNVGSQTGGFQVSDPGPGGAGATQPQWETGQQALNDYTQASIGAMNGAVGSGGYMTKSGPGGLQFRNMTPEEKAGNAAYTQNMSGGPNGTPNPGVYKSGPNGFSYASFEDGGAVDDSAQSDGDDSNDGNGALPHSMDGMQQAINRALQVVDNALSYGRKLHGLPDGNNGLQDPHLNQTQQLLQGDGAESGDGAAGDPGSPRYQDFNKSPNVEDRRPDGRTPGQNFMPALMPVVKPVNDFIGRAYSIYDKATSPNDPVDHNNPIAKDAGGDDLAGDQQHQSFQRNLADQQGEGAVPDDEDSQ